jgi:hypothetical protein
MGQRQLLTIFSRSIPPSVSRAAPLTLNELIAPIRKPYKRGILQFSESNLCNGSSEAEECKFVTK